MLLVGTAAALIALSSAAADCMSGNWAAIVKRTEMLIVHREELRVPQGPVGEKRLATCVRIRFQIDQNGVPMNVAIDQSSGNRTIDVAAREAVRRYQFEVPREMQAHYAVVLEIAPTW